MSANGLKLPEIAWSKKEGPYFLIGLSEKIFETIGSVVEIQFPEPGMEVLPGEAIFTISGTNEDFVLKSPVKGYFLEKNEDTLENFHFGEGDDAWVVKFEIPGL